jgi:hypothetical protein
MKPGQGLQQGTVLEREAVARWRLRKVPSFEGSFGSTLQRWFYENLKSCVEYHGQRASLLKKDHRNSML